MVVVFFVVVLNTLNLKRVINLELSLVVARTMRNENDENGYILSKISMSKSDDTSRYCVEILVRACALLWKCLCCKVRSRLVGMGWDRMWDTKRDEPRRLSSTRVKDNECKKRGIDSFIATHHSDIEFELAFFHTGRVLSDCSLKLLISILRHADADLQNST
jgi:hypothetical protein